MHHPYPPPYPAWQPAWQPAPERGGNGLAIAAIVLSVVALLGVLLMSVALFLLGGFGVSGETLVGRVEVDAGGGLTSVGLTRAVTERLEEDGGTVGTMSCPATPKVGQGVVTVCHGEIDGAGWAVVVYFESDTGDFTLGPI